MMKHRYFYALILVIVCGLLSGCLHSQYPKRTQYLLNIHSPTTPITPSKSAPILNVEHPTVAPQFSTMAFVYRTSDLNYLNDFYNVFFISPSLQMHQIVMRYLNQTGLFASVIAPENEISEQMILRTNVQELYADYRDHAHPQAVITIQFVLYRVVNEKKESVVFDQTFSQSVPLEEKSSTALVTAWNAGLQTILEQLTQAITAKKLMNNIVNKM
jgi:ABC-type uncharacterized transport system auxiliary subunit